MKWKIASIFPWPIKAADLDNDGKTEVITVENFGLTRSMTKNYRKLTDTKIESLSWDGLGLALNWETKKISGSIRGIDIGDFDNDGQLELVAVVVLKEGTAMIGDPLSTIIAYDID